MLSPTSAILALLGFLLLAGCSSKSEPQRPGVYRGGAYYGDAIHSEDVSR
jgi:hypothetical protein